MGLLRKALAVATDGLVDFKNKDENDATAQRGADKDAARAAKKDAKAAGKHAKG